MITRDFIFSLNNPIIFSLVAGIVFAVSVYFIYMKIFLPLQEKHKHEKHDLELKNSRLMAMFAELDPSPLFRFDFTGKVIFTNESGAEILTRMKIAEPLVSELIELPAGFSYDDFIKSGGIYQATVKMGEEFYDIIIKGIPETGFGQIYCSDITIRKNAEEELERSRKKLRELSVHIQKVQEEEKRKISRELHDNFGQILTSIKMNIEQLAEKHKNYLTEREFEDINNQLGEARREIRELSYQLRPRVLDDFGLAPALKALCDDTSKRSGITCVFQTHNITERLAPETETNIYRIVQEALNNIVKHSKAAEMSVQIINNNEKLVVTIEDDGVGFSGTAEGAAGVKSGMGLINMSERAISLNGKLYISSVPGKGTEIMIEIPLERNEKNKGTFS